MFDEDAVTRFVSGPKGDELAVGDLSFTEKHNPGPKTHKHRQSRRERGSNDSQKSALHPKHNPGPKTHKDKHRQTVEKQQRQSVKSQH